MNIEISVDTSRFDRKMADFPDAMARAQRNALVVIGNSVKNRATDAFKNLRCGRRPGHRARTTPIRDGRSCTKAAT